MYPIEDIPKGGTTMGIADNHLSFKTQQLLFLYLQEGLC